MTAPDANPAADLLARLRRNGPGSLDWLAADEIERLTRRLAECDAAVDLYEQQAAVVADRSASAVLAEYLELLFPGRPGVPEVHAGALLDWLAEHGFTVNRHAGPLPPGVNSVSREGVTVTWADGPAPGRLGAIVEDRLGTIVEELVAQLAADGALRHALDPPVTDAEVDALVAWLYPADPALSATPAGVTLDDCCLEVLLPPGTVPLLTLGADEVDPFTGEEIAWPLPRVYWSNGVITDGSWRPNDA